MARTNLNMTGFVPHNADSSDFIECWVASGYGTDILPGDPVVAQSDGSVQRTPAGSAAGAATDGIYGVCVDIIQYKDATGGFLRRNAKLIPASTTWTAHSDRSIIMVLPYHRRQLFRAKLSGALADLATARSAKWTNMDHSYSGADNGLGLSGARLNSATVGTTNTLQWRIEDFLDQYVANDPTQAGSFFLCYPNLPQVTEYGTGI